GARDVGPRADVAFHQASGGEVLELHHVGQLQYRSAGDVPCDEASMPFGGGGRGEDRAELVAQLLVVPPEVDVVTGVAVDQIGSTDVVAETLPELRLERTE